MLRSAEDCNRLFITDGHCLIMSQVPPTNPSTVDPIGPPMTNPTDGVADLVGLLRALLAVYPNPAAANVELVRIALTHAVHALERTGRSLSTPEYEVLEPVGR